jgi:hypothetical protein
MPTQFRPERLTRDAIPGEGMVDPIRDTLFKLGVRARDIEDDAASAVVRPPVIALLDSLANVRAFLWSLLDQWESRAKDMHTMISRAQQAAAATVPAYGHGSPADYETAKAGAVAQVRAEVLAGITSDLLAADDTTKRAAKLADAAVAAVKSAVDAVARARLDADSPPEMTIADLSTMSAWETRARGAKEPMQWLIQKLGTCIELGADEKLRTLLPTAERLATEWLQTPAPKLKAKDEARHDRGLGYDAAGPHAQADAVLKLIAAYREKTEPPSITEADAIIDESRNVFEALLGASARWLSAAERKRMYYTDAHRSEAPAEWQVDDGWVGRYLPPKGPALPGYSRPIGRLNSGAYARAPIGGASL